MQQQLEAPVDVSIREDNRTAVLAALAVQTGTNIVLDRSGKGHWMSSAKCMEKPLTAELRGVSLRSVLNIVCDQLQLTWTASREVIRMERRDSAKITQIYPVADLVQSIQPDQVAISGEALVDLICTNVTEDAWETDAQISWQDDSSCLVVRHTDTGHTEICDLLEDLRGTRSSELMIRCNLLEFSSSEQKAWLDEQVEFRTGAGQPGWCLLSARSGLDFFVSVAEPANSSLFRQAEVVVVTKSGLGPVSVEPVKTTIQLKGSFGAVETKVTARRVGRRLLQLRVTDAEADELGQFVVRPGQSVLIRLPEDHSLPASARRTQLLVLTPKPTDWLVSVHSD